MQFRKIEYEILKLSKRNVHRLIIGSKSHTVLESMNVAFVIILKGN